jgi:DNA repair exonuclease SbcCD ATPase subunit
MLADMELAARNTDHWTRMFNAEGATSDDGRMSKLTDRALELTGRLGALRAKVEALRERLQERKALRAKIADIEAQLDDIDALDVLDKAFSSSTGVKQMVINTICRSLEAQVNKYAKFLFPEDYLFEFDLATQFNITCTRTLGDTQLVSDVRRLSGAEAGLFNLVLALSLMSFLPPAKRCSVLVLDELNANFGPDVNQSFIRFLSVLNKVIPHIIVITPKSEDNYGEDVRYFTVVKRHNASTIVSGRKVTA